MSYRPKEDGSYVTSDSEGRGDVQAVSIPSNEQRRVGARNGIEVRKQRRHRRCSGALLLINLVLPLSQVAAETDAPRRRPTRSGAHVLACRSPELFVAQAWEFTRSGIVNSVTAFSSKTPRPRLRKTDIVFKRATTNMCASRLSFSHSASGRRKQLFSILAKVRSFPRHNFLR